MRNTWFSREHSVYCANQHELASAYQRIQKLSGRGLISPPVRCWVNLYTERLNGIPPSFETACELVAVLCRALSVSAFTLRGNRADAAIAVFLPDQPVVLFPRADSLLTRANWERDVLRLYEEVATTIDPALFDEDRGATLVMYHRRARTLGFREVDLNAIGSLLGIDGSSATYRDLVTCDPEVLRAYVPDWDDYIHI
jgi:hypothetical protein